MGTHPIFESDFDCLTEQKMEIVESEIEKILPAYRAAIHCELLSEAEVKQLLYRAQQNNEAEPLIYDQLFRVELINAAILRKRLEITGTVSLESESANIELVDGSAAIKVAELAMKTFPTNGHLVAAMLRCVLNCATPFDTVKAFLIDALLGMDSVSALDARAQYYVAHVTNGLDLAKNVYQSELEKERDDGAEVLAQYIGFLAQHKSTSDLTGAIERLESLLALETNIAERFTSPNTLTRTQKPSSRNFSSQTSASDLAISK